MLRSDFITIYVHNGVTILPDYMLIRLSNILKDTTAETEADQELDQRYETVREELEAIEELYSE